MNGLYACDASDISDNHSTPRLAAASAASQIARPYPESRSKRSRHGSDPSTPISSVAATEPFSVSASSTRCACVMPSPANIPR